MIIRKDKTYETRSDKPNTNWYKNEDNYIVDETTEEGLLLKEVYIENYPFVDFEHDGKFITTVTVLNKPEKPPEIEGKEIRLIHNEEEWEYIYVDIPLTKEQELELKLTKLEEENLNIMLATTEMYEEQYNENLNLMLAITELYEMNMEV